MCEATPVKDFVEIHKPEKKTRLFKRMLKKIKETYISIRFLFF